MKSFSDFRTLITILHFCERLVKGNALEHVENVSRTECGAERCSPIGCSQYEVTGISWLRGWGAERGVLAAWTVCSLKYYCVWVMQCVELNKICHSEWHQDSGANPQGPRMNPKMKMIPFFSITFFIALRPVSCFREWHSHSLRGPYLSWDLFIMSPWLRSVEYICSFNDERTWQKTIYYTFYTQRKENMALFFTILVNGRGWIDVLKIIKKYSATTERKKTCFIAKRTWHFGWTYADERKKIGCYSYLQDHRNRPSNRWSWFFIFSRTQCLKLLTYLPWPWLGVNLQRSGSILRFSRFRWG